MKFFPLFLFLAIAFISCNSKTEDPIANGSEATLRFKFKFEENQERLNAIGEPATIAVGNAAQTPLFNQLSVHVIDLSPNRFTPYGEGFLAYKGAETTTGGANAVDFERAIVAEEGVFFMEIPIHSIPIGTYEYSRVSVSYQNYAIQFNINEIPLVGDLNNQTGTIASFLGFNNYITSATIKDKNITVNDDKPQGFWAFETNFDVPYEQYDQVYSGESASTTVVNPLAGDSDIPAGSCIVTGAFDTPLVITGEETEDIEITLSFSINNSFEWRDDNGNGQLDFYGDGTDAEQVIDMGLRGMVVHWE